jgi:outer membrane protein assembly factor BamA
MSPLDKSKERESDSAQSHIEKAISEDSSKMAFSSFVKKSEQSPYPIRKIFITIDYHIPENEDSVRSLIKLLANNPFNLHLADKAIYSLFATNFFEDIHISADQKEDEALNLAVS